MPLSPAVTSMELSPPRRSRDSDGRLAQLECDPIGLGPGESCPKIDVCSSTSLPNMRMLSCLVIQPLTPENALLPS